MALNRRPPTKRNYVVTELRQAIVRGDWGPGDQLPGRHVLLERFQTGQRTIEAALGQLARDGFVRAEGRRGTFVAERPPHLWQYGLVFPRAASSSKQPASFYGALRQVADQWRNVGWQFRQYHDVDGRADAEVQQQLVADLHCRRLAGVIFANSPHKLKHTSVLEQSHTPMAYVTFPDFMPPIPPRRVWDDIGLVQLSRHAFREQAVAHLRHRHCQRIATINITQASHIGDAKACPFLKTLGSHGLACRPGWHHLLPPDASQAAGSITKMLFQPTLAQDRPDGLIVGDDTMVQPATEALREMGVRVPGDVAVVAECNYPSLPASAVPVTWLGFNVADVLDGCMQKLGEHETVIEIPPQFGDAMRNAPSMTHVPQPRPIHEQARQSELAGATR